MVFLGFKGFIREHQVASAFSLGILPLISKAVKWRGWNVAYFQGENFKKNQESVCREAEKMRFLPRQPIRCLLEGERILDISLIKPEEFKEKKFQIESIISKELFNYYNRSNPGKV